MNGNSVRRFRFNLRHLTLLVFTVTLIFGLAKLGTVAILLFPILFALYGLGTGTIASAHCENSQTERVFLVIYGFAVLALAMLLIGAFQRLLHGR